jgi:hypothetical protein
MAEPRLRNPDLDNLLSTRPSLRLSRLRRTPSHERRRANQVRFRCKLLALTRHWMRCIPPNLVGRFFREWTRSAGDSRGIARCGEAHPVAQLGSSSPVAPDGDEVVRDSRPRGASRNAVGPSGRGCDAFQRVHQASDACFTGRALGEMAFDVRAGDKRESDSRASKWRRRRREGLHAVREPTRGLKNNPPERS